MRVATFLACTGTGLMAGPSWRCGLKKPGLLLSFCLLGADKLGSVDRGWCLTG